MRTPYYRAQRPQGRALAYRAAPYAHTTVWPAHPSLHWAYRQWYCWLNGIGNSVTNWL